MGRKVDVDELVGFTEIVERLDLKSKQAVRSWRSRYPDFPAPVAQLALGPVWAWRDIERWAQAGDHLRVPPQGDHRQPGVLLTTVTAHTVSERLTRWVLRNFAADAAERVLQALAALPAP